MVIKARKANGLYVLDRAALLSEVLVVAFENLNKTTLWHKRLGHISGERTNRSQQVRPVGWKQARKVGFLWSLLYWQAIMSEVQYYST